MLITNTALGSFGFELEEYRTGQMPIDEKTTLDLAIERTQSLLQGSIDPDDELLADTASGLDQRALDKVRAFISTLAENEAVCALQYRTQHCVSPMWGRFAVALSVLARTTSTKMKKFLRAILRHSSEATDV